jgi:hypothetical protein
MKLPKAKQNSPEWQAAAEALLMASEDRGPLMHAHVGAGAARCKADSRVQSIKGEVLGTAKADVRQIKQAASGTSDKLVTDVDAALLGRLRRVRCFIAPQGEGPIAIEASIRAGLIAAWCHHQDQFVPALRARRNGDQISLHSAA